MNCPFDKRWLLKHRDNYLPYSHYEADSRHLTQSRMTAQKRPWHINHETDSVCLWITEGIVSVPFRFVILISNTRFLIKVYEKHIWGQEH